MEDKDDVFLNFFKDNFYWKKIGKRLVEWVIS